MAAAFTFSVAAAAFLVVTVTTTSAAAFALSVTAAFTILMMMSALAATVAMMLLWWKELTVKAFRKFLLCSLAYGDYFHGEHQCLSCHREVEIHSDIILLDIHDHSMAYLTLAIEHRDILAHDEKVLAQLSIYFK